MSLADKLTSERRSRLAAERMLELKKSELFAANSKLDQHARQLSEEIVETRAEVETIRGENQRVKSDLSAAHQRIAITERRLWQSIETISDGFALFDSNNKMIMANKAYLAVFDGIEEIAPGVDYVTVLQVLTEEGIINTSDLKPPQWRQMMIERRQQLKPDPVVVQLWNGSHIRLVDQRGPDGDVVSLGIDITASVKYEKQLDDAREIAESANRAKSSFLANMSHEIRTPMNGVVGMADVLKDTDLTDDQRLYVDTIRNSGQALLVIINDVLDFSKIEAKKLELQPEVFDFELAIQEIIMLLQPTARAKGLILLLDYDLSLPTNLIGDPGRLRQVLTNLLGNAVKFTSKGHVIIRVSGETDSATNTASLQIAIEDTGIGIPSDKVAHIFGEFHQVQNDRNRQYDGTGLGLAITQRLVEMMGGKIWVTSQDGVGSCFGVKVTLDLPDDAPPQHRTQLYDAGQVLVLSNNDATRSLLLGQLRSLGLDAVASDGNQATVPNLSADTALILVDHHMPDLNGLAFAKTVRLTEPDVPILLLTSMASHVEKDPDRGNVQAVLQYPSPGRDLVTQIKLLTHCETELPAPKRPKLKVLAAEDNKTNQLVFRKMVKDLDIDLTFADNGEEAVKLFQKIEPDLIFMDISMPKMDGKVATKTIREIEAMSGQHVTIVALTAHAMQGDDAGILAAGLDHYLTKPLRKADIVGQIEAVHTEQMKPLHPDQEDG